MRCVRVGGVCGVPSSRARGNTVSMSDRTTAGNGKDVVKTHPGPVLLVLQTDLETTYVIINAHTLYDIFVLLSAVNFSGLFRCYRARAPFVRIAVSLTSGRPVGRCHRNRHRRLEYCNIIHIYYVCVTTKNLYKHFLRRRRTSRIKIIYNFIRFISVSKLTYFHNIKFN